MAEYCVSDPVVAPLLTPPLAAKSGSMPEPSNEGPAKSGRKRGRGACAPANRRPSRTLAGTKQAKATVGEFLVLFAAKKYRKPCGPRRTTASNPQKNLGLRPACTIFGSALNRRRLGKLQTSLHLRSPCTIFVFIYERSENNDMRPAARGGRRL